MGWSKYNEDNNEINEIRLARFEKEEIKKREMIRCPYCFSYFNTKDELYIHIKENYNEPKYYLIINGIVVNYDLPITNIASASITSRDEKNIFFINGNEIIINEEKDITYILQEEMKNCNSITIKINNDEFNVYKINYGNIDINKVNSIIDEWNIETSLNKLSINKYKNDLNITETLLLNGIYNYFAGTLCVNSKEKDQRYFDSLKFLYGFSDRFTIARHIIQVLCFKYNWGDKLKDFADDSKLYKVISSFFVGERVTLLSDDNNKSLYIEDDLETLINICSGVMYLNDLSKEEFNRFYYNDDSNVVDKIKIMIYREDLLNDNISECEILSKEIKSLYFKKQINE